MNVEMKSEFPVTDEACKSATGKSLSEWSVELSDHPEFVGKRREAINWLWDQVGRNPTGVWWGTTIWVEHERRIGKLQKDGRIEGYGICSTKTVVAPVDKVLSAVAQKIPNITKIRDGKGIRAKWQTPGCNDETDIDAVFVENAGKTAITLNHNRIQTREEADGLRRFWSECLGEIKNRLES